MALSRMQKNLKLLFFMIIGPGSIIFVLPWLILSLFDSLGFSQLMILRYAGTGFIVAGTALSLWCVYDFVSKGKGTPVPAAPPENLVTEGLYRFTRNPMYIGILFLLFGEAVVFQSLELLCYTGVVFLLFHLFIIMFEEPRLRDEFGTAYENYCRDVPRWGISMCRQSRNNNGAKNG